MDSETLIYKFALAKKLLREIAAEWMGAEDVDKFREGHVETYGSELSFEDLIRNVESIKFK
jgi:hypothetical protein